jgi:hypothetical protein
LMWMVLGGPAASITAAFMVSGSSDFVVISLCLSFHVPLVHRCSRVWL